MIWTGAFINRTERPSISFPVNSIPDERGLRRFIETIFRIVLLHFRSVPFFLSWALLRANSCVLQLRCLCFLGFSLNPFWFLPRMQPLALEAEALASGCSRKMRRKKEPLPLHLQKCQVAIRRLPNIVGNFLFAPQ